MATNEKVAAMVRAELAKNNEVENSVLLQKARELDPKMKRFNVRQFHGSYRLPALRAAKRASQGGGAAPAPKAEAPVVRRRVGRPPKAQAEAPAQAQAGNGEANGGPRRTRVRRATASGSGAGNERGLETIRQMLTSVVREAMSVEDRASFIRLFDSLDERARAILGVASR